MTTVQQTTSLTPASPSSVETIPGGPLLLMVYGFAWAVVVLYVLALWRKSGQVQRELAELSAKIDGRVARR